MDDVDASIYQFRRREGNMKDKKRGCNTPDMNDTFGRRNNKYYIVLLSFYFFFNVCFCIFTAILFVSYVFIFMGTKCVCDCK